VGLYLIPVALRVLSSLRLWCFPAILFTTCGCLKRDARGRVRQALLACAPAVAAGRNVDVCC